MPGTARRAKDSMETPSGIEDGSRGACKNDTLRSPFTMLDEVSQISNNGKTLIFS
jgi:hypothetical protein